MIAFLAAYARRFRTTRCRCSGCPHMQWCPRSLRYREGS
jgi:hypothetical protein